MKKIKNTYSYFDDNKDSFEKTIENLIFSYLDTYEE